MMLDTNVNYKVQLGIVYNGELTWRFPVVAKPILRPGVDLNRPGRTVRTYTFQALDNTYLMYKTPDDKLKKIEFWEEHWTGSGFKHPIGYELKFLDMGGQGETKTSRIQALCEVGLMGDEEQAKRSLLEIQEILQSE